MNPKALFDMSYGVYFAAALDGDKKVGCAANTAFQVTASPIRLGVSINKDNYTEDCIRRCGYFTLSIASEFTAMETIGRFGFYSSRDIDKYDGTKYITTQDGYPIIDDNTCSWVLCKVGQEIDCGTHTIFIGEMTEGEKLRDLPPMTYAHYHKVKGGTTAKNAPTYIEEAPDTKADAPYVCSVCGYKYPGTAEEFESLPDDWKCPVCGVDKPHFVQK